MTTHHAPDDRLESLRTMVAAGPAVELSVRPPSLATSIRERWTPRRLVVMGVLWPLVTALIWMLAGDVRSIAVVVLFGFGIALSLTTYTPAPGQSLTQVLGSPCASVGGVLPGVCAVSLLTKPSASVLIALALVLFGLYQRFSGSEACGLSGGRRP